MPNATKNLCCEAFGKCLDFENRPSRLAWAGHNFLFLYLLHPVLI